MDRRNEKTPQIRLVVMTITVDDFLYDFTVEFLQKHVYISSKSLAVVYYKIDKAKPTSSQMYGFSRVIRVLEKQGLIKKFNGKNWRRVD